MNFNEAFAAGAQAGLVNTTIGLVTSVEDPEGLNRVKVSFPLLENLESDWARVVTFFAGPEYGGFFHPKIGNEVLVGFLHGNPNLPYILGCLWNGQDRPQVPAEEQTTLYSIQTETGLTVSLDEGESPGILVKDAADNSIRITSEENKISVQANESITLTCAEGAISLTGARISIVGEEEISISGGMVNISADEEMALSAPLLRLN